MHIQVRGSAPYSCDDVQLDDNLTVAELRSLLRGKFNINEGTHSIRLLHRGRLMQDANSVRSYGVEENSTVHIVVQPRQANDGNVNGGTQARGTSQSSQQQSAPYAFNTFHSSSGSGNEPWAHLASAVANSIGAAFQQQQPMAATAALGGAVPTPVTITVVSDEMGTGAPTSDSSGAGNGVYSNPTMNSLASQIPSVISSVLTNMYGSFSGNPSPGQQPQGSAAGHAPGGLSGQASGSSQSMAPPIPPRTAASGNPTQTATENVMPGVREGQNAGNVAPGTASHDGASQVPGLPNIRVFSSVQQPHAPMFMGVPAATPIVQPPPTVMHIHVHCRPDELDAMPERLRRLSEEMSVGHFTQRVDAPRPYQAPQQPRPTPPNATPATAASAPAHNDGTFLWAEEASETIMSVLAPHQIMLLMGGDLSGLALLRAPLQQQLQQRFAGIRDTAAAMVRMAHREAQVLAERLLNSPGVQNLLTAQTAAARAAPGAIAVVSQRTERFRQEIPRFLEHFLHAVMIHIRSMTGDAAEWGRELRNIAVRFSGMALARSAHWFNDGRNTLESALASTLQAILQSNSIGQRFGALQAFSPMVLSILHSLSEQWANEYNQHLRRGDDDTNFERGAEPQAAPQESSAPSNGTTAEQQSPVLRAGCAGNTEGQAVPKTDIKVAKDNFEDLAKELMEDVPSSPTDATTPKGASRLLPATAVATEAGAAAAVVSPTRLASAVDDWEEACNVPHHAAERIAEMATLFHRAQASAAASQPTPATRSTAPPDSATHEDREGWVMWETNPYDSPAPQK